MRWLCALLLFTLAACASFGPPKPVLERTASIITVKIDPALPTLGQSMWTGQLCTITLREYPYCLQHEVRHCLEGKWHGDDHNGDDCF